MVCDMTWFNYVYKSICLPNLCEDNEPNVVGTLKEAFTGGNCNLRGYHYLEYGTTKVSMK